jgi:hypothetical protein
MIETQATFFSAREIRIEAVYSRFCNAANMLDLEMTGS